MNSTLRQSLPFILLAISISVFGQTEIKYSSSTMKGTDFKTYHTYAWLPYIDSINVADYNKEKVHAYISETITKELIARGLTVDTIKPDILVRYSIMFNRRESSKQENIYGKPNVGVGMGFGSGGYGGMSVGVSSPSVVGVATIPIVLREGALIVDIIDLNTNQIVWWGAAGRSKEDKGELTNTKMVIDEVVPKIFKKLPMKKVKKKKE